MIDIKASTTSIEDCIAVVKQLDQEGVSSADIYVITNHASKAAILQNRDLRRKDGSFFSSHFLNERVNTIFNLKEYQTFFEKESAHGSDPLKEHIAAIQNGCMVVVVLKPG